VVSDPQKPVRRPICSSGRACAERIGLSAWAWSVLGRFLQYPPQARERASVPEMQARKRTCQLC
jgi:hypothetical protein